MQPKMPIRGENYLSESLPDHPRLLFKADNIDAIRACILESGGRRLDVFAFGDGELKLSLRQQPPYTGKPPRKDAPTTTNVLMIENADKRESQTFVVVLAPRMESDPRPEAHAEIRENGVVTARFMPSAGEPAELRFPGDSVPDLSVAVS